MIFFKKKLLYLLSFDAAKTVKEIGRIFSF